MKRKLLAGMLGLFLTIRLFPAASIFWAEAVSLPAMRILAGLGALFPFALLELMASAVCLLLPVSLFRKRFLKTVCSMLLILLLGWFAVWWPLYFLPQPAYSAGSEEISRTCEALISELNASSFSAPGDLPAKFIRFPQWMDALNISGICSFLTGEALISPDVPPVSQPFVAVHEAMHLRGYAAEGAANIAAWEECISRGGVYAYSARIWALRYCMGILRQAAPASYEANMLRMNHETLQAYRQAGGAYTAPAQPQFLQRLYASLGIERALQDYEILAHYLAAKWGQ